MPIAKPKSKKKNNKSKLHLSFISKWDKSYLENGSFHF